jgi:CubicO group peptidase (beta-lactamase class C family)
MAESDIIRGVCPSGFSPVKAAFEANFAEGLELGARFSLAVEGEIVVDLMGGFSDRAQTRSFAEDSLTPIFSTTKAMASLMIARLVEAGKLAYDQPVADLWPAFGQAGKAQVTVEQALSHQAGLCGLEGPMSPDDWFDWDGICERLAAMAPLWPPGTASGYHPVTFGYLAGEIFRRADGRTLGAALREDLAGPLGLDLWIGLPDAEHARVAEVRRPSALPELGQITKPKELAFLTRWAQPSAADAGRLRRAEIPSLSGHATALALARLMSLVATSPGLAAAAARSRVSGQDLVLPYRLSWGAGFLRNEGLGIYGPGLQTFGHSGWGGSCAFADPERRIAGAYVMNRQSPALIGDARPRRLIDAAYATL